MTVRSYVILLKSVAIINPMGYLAVTTDGTMLRDKLAQLPQVDGVEEIRKGGFTIEFDAPLNAAQLERLDVAAHGALRAVLSRQSFGDLPKDTAFTLRARACSLEDNEE